MGLYADQLVPRLIHFAMRGEKFQDLRRGLVGRAKGRVLEIGIGSGLNLPFYGAEVENVTGIDPSETGLVLAERNAQSTRINVDLIQGGAERVPTSDAMYDTVVSTWTLCSVENVNEVKDLAPLLYTCLSLHIGKPEAQKAMNYFSGIEAQYLNSLSLDDIEEIASIKQEGES